MASPSERLSSEGSGGWTATRSRAELLVSVRARGTRIRRRRRTIVVGTLAAVSVVLLAPLVFSQRDVGRQLTAEGGPVTTPAPGDLEAVPTSSPPLPIRPGDADEPQQAGGSMGRPGAGSSSSTTTTGGTAGATGADGTDSATGEPLDGAASLPAGSVSTTTTDPRCRQSHDPTCGPFFWMDPLPPDVHPAITLTANPDPPVAGIPVTFVFSVRDVDGPVADECFEFFTGDGAVYSVTNGMQVTGPVNCPPPRCPEPTGGWTAPQRSSDVKSFTIVHTYLAPGDNTLHVRARPAGSGTCVNNPFADGFDVSYRVSVVPYSRTP